MIDYHMSNADYHASPAISKSGLDLIAKSPAHYIHAKQQPHEPTEAMIIGSAFHDAVLLPDTFNDNYAVSEKFDRRTKAGKEAAAQFDADNKGKLILNIDQVGDIERMIESINAHEKASILLTGGNPEVSIFWRDADTQIDCRCRPDFIHSSGIMVDLKSTIDASPEAFAKSCANFRYHVQDAFYSEGFYRETGVWPKGFVFIAVEKTAPYAVGVYELDAESRALGRELFTRDLLTYQNSLSSQTWPAYSPDIETLRLPQWAFNI